MNISSVLLIIKPEFKEAVLGKIKAIKNASVELQEGEKLIVLLESEDLDSELRAYKALESLPHIISANMIFSYQDLDEDIAKIKDEVASVLKNDTKAEDIKYYGNAFNQI